jgi:hypothetical protein
VPLAEAVLLAPIIGDIDTWRAQTITSRLLDNVGALHAWWGWISRAYR